MSLATFEDANVHLDESKIEFTTAGDAEGEATAADRYIRGMLHPAFGDAVTTWDAAPSGGSQADTPELVRQVAAYLMAYFRYAKIYSEETLVQNSYAMWLKNEADKILTGIQEGTIELVDVTTEVIDVGSPSFFPDDEYVDLDTMEPIRMFTVGQEF